MERAVQTHVQCFAYKLAPFQFKFQDSNSTSRGLSPQTNRLRGTIHRSMTDSSSKKRPRQLQTFDQVTKKIRDIAVKSLVNLYIDHTFKTTSSRMDASRWSCPVQRVCFLGKREFTDYRRNCCHKRLWLLPELYLDAGSARSEWPPCNSIGTLCRKSSIRWRHCIIARQIKPWWSNCKQALDVVPKRQEQKWMQKGAHGRGRIDGESPLPRGA